MELQTTCKRMGTMETVFDDFDEHPVDCDFMLPDYLPDIAAVLKCIMKPVVQSHQISGDRVMADGTVYLQLLYLDEARRCVHSFEYSQPFSSAFTVKELKSSDSVRLCARVNYVNCRATSPRRVDVHGAFNVRLTVKSEGGCEVITAAQGDGLYTRDCTVSGSVPAGSAEKTVSLNEVVELGVSAQALVRSEAVACITECRQMPEKAIIKGDVLLSAVVVIDSEAGTLQCVKHTVPFSLILDVDGLTEEQVCDCRVTPTLCEVRLMQDPAGENRLLSVAVKLAVTLDCYCTEHFTMVTDAYHTAFPMKNESRRVEPCCLTFVRSDTATITASCALPEGDIASVVDVWCEPLPAACRGEAGQTVLSGQLLVCLLARDSQGVLSYYERLADYETMLADMSEQTEVGMVLLDTDYTHNGDRLDLRCQAAVHRVGSQLQSQMVLTQLAVDESTPFGEDAALAGCCLKVCYAAAGESVWELARRERTSPDALKAENNLTGDTLEQDTMLLIPMR